MNWDRLETLYAEAMALPEAERPAFVAGLDDPGLRDELASLLAHSTAADGFLDRVGRVVADVAPQGPEQVGPYEILEEIGRGGMATVYLARDTRLDRTVALKLVRAGLDSDELRLRFDHERRILAALEHPHIARIYDGGVAGDGRPYLAMEYVDGEPLDVYCAGRKLSVEDRLALFETVCEAVQFAHRNLIVHRDLKPSNILVAPPEEGTGGAGTVTLLDFGIAKLLDEAVGEEEAPQTRTGMRVMTPAYASPEQIGGGSITTASDVYALGVVLYELLTGRRPHDLRGLTAGEAERAVLTREPVRPSTAVAGAEGGGEETAGLAHPERLRRRLRGDLDTIVLKALRKEPERRYASAEGLAADLRRHLAGLPVEARPDTLGYRMRKFVRRHRVGVATAAAGLLLLVGFAGTLAVQQAETARERDRARLEAEKLAEVRDFLVDLFRANDPAQSLGEAATVRDLLDRGVERIDALADRPVVQADLMATLGDVHRRLGNYPEAETLLTRALEIHRAEYPDGHEALAHNLSDLAMLHFALGDYRAAVPFNREAMEVLRPLRGEQDPEVMSLTNNLATLLSYTGDPEEAAVLYEDVLRMRRRVLGPEDPKVAVSMNNLGMTYYEQGDLDRAEPLLRETLELRRRILPAAHPDVALSLNNLATVLRERGRIEKAEPLYREALAMRRDVYGDDHPRVASTLYNLGRLLQARGVHAEAEAAYREMVAINRSRKGTEHPDVGLGLHALGALMAERGERAEAETMLREAVEILRASLAEDDARRIDAERALEDLLAGG